MRNKITTIIIMVSLILLNSCKKEEAAIFDKNASARMTEAIEKVHKTLQARDGWLIKYYPNKTRIYGGYTLFASFTSDSEVEIASDVDDNMVKSTYAIIPESGPILSFNTYNEIIHLFSEPGNDSGVGPADSGMGGDFEFIVLETTDDKITLKGKKSGNLMVMISLDSSRDEDLSDKYVDEAVFFNEFGSFVIEMPDKSIKGISTNYRTFTVEDPANPAFFTFRVVPGGLELYQEVTIQGVKISTMTYHPAESAYPLGYYSDPSNAVKIIPKATDLNTWFIQNTWGFAYSKVGPTGALRWNLAKAALDKNGWTLDAFSIGSYSTSKGLVFVINGGIGLGVVTYPTTKVAGTTDQVRLAFGGSLSSFGAFGVANWSNALVNFNASLDGKTFKITGISGPNRPSEILLTDIADPNNTYQIVIGEVEDPFNK